MRNNSLTTRQKEILDFLISDIKTQGFPPTVAEVQKEFSFKSPTAAQDHLNALKRKGYIARHPLKSRGIEIIKISHTTPCYVSEKKTGYNLEEKPSKGFLIDGPGSGAHYYANHTITLPIVGRVAAGTPILAEENIEGTLSIDESLVRQANKAYILRVKGDSMENAGILNGDYIVVQQQLQVNNGEIAVVLFDNEATVKRVYKEKNRIRLQPENDSMGPIYINPKQTEVSVIGKVQAVIRKI